MFKRLLNLSRGLVGLCVSGLERKRPAALLELEKERLRGQITLYNEGLVGHAGLCERLLSQVKRLKTEEQDLRHKAAVNLRAGNLEVAGQYALRLQTVSAQWQESRAQAASAEKTYQELVLARDQAVRAAQEKIQRLKYDLDDLKVKQATAQLHEMAGAMIGHVDGTNENLVRLSALVDEEREKAAGRARVARDTLATGNLFFQEKERKALADQALEDFAAGEGLTISLPASSPAPRTAGPRPALEAGES